MDITLAKYILIYYSNLLSGKEQLFYRHATSMPILSTETLEKMLLELGWLDDSNHAELFFHQEKANFLRITNDEFDKLVASKILERHADKIFLNYCPTCKRLARTPFAKQCRCGHSWHDTQNLKISNS